MEISNNHLMNYTLDRYEGEYAILLDTKARQFDVLIEELPDGASEGDVFIYTDGAYVFNEEETKIKREKIKKIKANIERKY